MAGSVIQKHDDTRLPKDWEVITLGEILPLTYGSGLTESNRDASGNVPVYGSNGIVGRHSSAITSGPCLIVGRKGAAGAVHYSCEPCWVIDTTYFAEGTPCTDLRFFYYVLSSANLRELDRSTAVPSLSRNDYNAVAVPLPPLGEQRRIAARLDELLSGLDAAVAALERVRGNLQRYRASVLKAAVEGRLTEEWRAQHPNTEPATVLLERTLRERRRRWEEEQLAKYAAKGQNPPANWQSKYKPPTAPDTTDLPHLPEGWCWVTLDQVAAYANGAITDGPFGSNLKTEHYRQSGPRVVRLQNIGEGKFVDEHAHISERHYETLRKHAVEAGDVVIASLGNELPRACTIPAWLGPGIVKADCIRLRLNRDVAEPAYLIAVLNAEPTRKRVASTVHGVGRPRLNLSEVRTIVIPLPPLREQQAISEEVEERLFIASASDGLVDRGIGRAARLRQAILKRAFEGRLVPQDPTDEPASVLLERISAAKALADAPDVDGTSRRNRKGPVRIVPERQLHE